MFPRAGYWNTKNFEPECGCPYCTEKKPRKKLSKKKPSVKKAVDFEDKHDVGDEKDIEQGEKDKEDESEFEEEPDVEESTVKTKKHKEQGMFIRCIKYFRTVPGAGIISALMSGLFFGIANLVVKFVPKVNPFVTIIFQGVMQVLCFLPVMILNGYDQFGVEGEKFSLFLRGSLGFVSVITSYISYRLIPLSDATTIISAAVVVVSIIAWIFLREECQIFQTVVVFVTLAGVTLVARPTFLFDDEGTTNLPAGARLGGTIAAVGCCITAAITYVCIRKLQKTSSVVVIYYYAISCIIFSVISVLFIHVFLNQNWIDKLGGKLTGPETWADIGWLVLNGTANIFAQITLTISFKIEEAGLVSLVRTGDIIIAFVLQLLFLGDEKIMWTSYLGAVIVFSGVFISGLRHLLKSKPGKYDTIWLIINCCQERQIVAKPVN